MEFDVKLSSDPVVEHLLPSRIQDARSPMDKHSIIAAHVSDAVNKKICGVVESSNDMQRQLCHQMLLIESGMAAIRKLIEKQDNEISQLRQETAMLSTFASMDSSGNMHNIFNRKSFHETTHSEDIRRNLINRSVDATPPEEEEKTVDNER